MRRIVLSAFALVGIAWNAGVTWRQLAPGLEFARWPIPRYDSASGQGYCHLGEPYVAVLRIEPNSWRFEVLHYSLNGDRAEPLTIEKWQEQTSGAIVFNAGQYYPDLSYMGLLRNGDQEFGARLHPQWQALFVAEPSRKGVRHARVIDLKYDQFRLGATPYTRIAQSFMLFDHTGRKRVKKGNWVANRTGVAEDRKGRILVFVTEGGLTLWDFARLLQNSGLNLVKAMSMDGGYESELAVHTRSFDYVSYGQWETNDYGDISLPGIHMPLPAVIALYPR
jgi:uncharacterized protein YigE (DUF2233 family)